MSFDEQTCFTRPLYKIRRARPTVAAISHTALLTISVNQLCSADAAMFDETDKSFLSPDNVSPIADMIHLRLLYVKQGLATSIVHYKYYCVCVSCYMLPLEIAVMTTHG